MQKISLKSIDGQPTGKPIKPSNTKCNQQLHNNYLFAEVAVHQFGHKIAKYSMKKCLFDEVAVQQFGHKIAIYSMNNY